MYMYLIGVAGYQKPTSCSTQLLHTGYLKLILQQITQYATLHQCLTVSAEIAKKLGPRYTFVSCNCWLDFCSKVLLCTLVLENSLHWLYMKSGSSFEGVVIETGHVPAAHNVWQTLQLSSAYASSLAWDIWLLAFWRVHGQVLLWWSSHTRSKFLVNNAHPTYEQCSWLADIAWTLSTEISVWSAKLNCTDCSLLHNQVFDAGSL